MNRYLAFTFVFAGAFAAVATAQQVEIRKDGDIVVNGITISTGSEPEKAAQKETPIPDIDGLIVSLAGAQGENGVLQFNLGDSVLFSFDSAQISQQGAKQLRKIAQVIKTKAKGGVWVIGHTDNKGSRNYNKQLSMRRALAVIDWLARHTDIDPNQLTPQGAGPDYPVAPNTIGGQDNPAGRAKNRRVEIQIATIPGVQLGAGKFIALSVAGTDPVLTTGNGTCQTLCQATAGKHGMQTIGCVEAAFEEQGFDMDEGACDKLEDAMFLGLGNAKGQACLACVKASGAQDSQCAKVQASCFLGQ